MSHLCEIPFDNDCSSIFVPLDVITRWNSIAPMINPYLEVKGYIKLALEKLGEGEKFYVRYDETLQQMQKKLDPLTEVVFKLSKASLSLDTAEFAIRNVLDKLVKN
jgi:hypothetical protein